MRDDLAPLDDVSFGGLPNSSIWPSFEMDLVEFPGIDALMGDLGAHQLDAPLVSGGTFDSGGPDRNRPSSGDAELEGLGGPPSLDRNNPSVLNEDTSLLLFANNPSARRLDLEGYDPPKQATIQALAAKLDLDYAYDPFVGVIRLQKGGSGRPSLERYAQQKGTAPGLTTAFKDPISSPLLQWEFGNDARNQHYSIPKTNEPSSHLCGSVEMGIDSRPRSYDSWRETGYHSSGTNIHDYDLGGELGLGSNSPRVAPSLLRRGPWPGSTLTLKDVGACWRCKILRKGCDSEQPCKACTRPAMNNKSRWQAIGCKRGSLLDYMSPVMLCPKANATREANIEESIGASPQVPETPIDYTAELCLEDASSRLDAIFASEKDSFDKVVLDILCLPLVTVTSIPLSRRHDIDANVIHIAWGLVDIPSAKNILCIDSVEDTLEVLKAAITYEKEYGLSPIIPMAIECFRNCIEILRLLGGGVPLSQLHNGCTLGDCQAQPFLKLGANIKSFTNELSKVIFRKENRLNDKRWWLSTFYSLWIQSYVRRTILFVESHFKAQGHSEPDSEIRCACPAYLLLSLEVFDASSASFDPLVSTWSLDKEPPNMDLRLIKYYRLAQKALFREQGVRDIGSSIDYLRRLYHDCDMIFTTYTQGDIRPVSIRRPRRAAESNAVPPALPLRQTPLQLATSARSEDQSLVPVKARSGAKRRAGSLLKDVEFIRRNGSSSSMPDNRDIRSRGVSLGSPASPVSSAYSVAYETSSSVRWSGSAEGLMVYGTGPPDGRDHFDYFGPSKGHRPRLHYKSSNESLVEISRTLNKRGSTNEKINDAADSPREPLVCDCCPKRPKRFDTIEELRAHATGKQHECSYCGSRFKSKNEAERHQNSLHLRRHAWSCSAILKIGYKGVFHGSVSQPGVADTCGYCGKDFGRNGGDGTSRLVDEKDWDYRCAHLKEAHRFGECDAEKRFYRADHFRQHLKHCHAGVLGKWINMLGNSCMLELPPPGEPANSF
ncbi:hypothetical protein GGS23DRAFT_619624 [Durotheca rogersii]|uniref:uncharacterized protein n=1 Tax=Durotheca rogersii TaxID=419775 RepID=UPI002220658A|nr:uncharacterized protein GGS23DRAFT_619624 [Durotheca rogersii]KAI5864918.1 hypothetical protein GGS23DRAFT_619624 [Durotheca rogersii]